MPITISGSTGIAGVDGSASTPAVQGTDTNTGIAFPAADTVAIGTGGTERMRVDSSGNVGIGTTSPGRKVDIEQSGTDYQLRIGDAGGNYYDIGRNTANGLLTFNGNQAAASGYVFSTVNGERARITTGGDFLVGATSAFTTNTSGVALRNLGTAGRIVLSSTNSGADLMYFYTSTALAGSIVTSGGTATAYNTTSDYRLKEDVRPIQSGLNTITALNPVTYKWKVNNGVGEGFIAHELQSVIPAAVTGEKDAVNDDGSIKPQGVDYSKIVVHLVAAIQELKAENDDLKARLTALEAK